MTRLSRMLRQSAARISDVGSIHCVLERIENEFILGYDRTLDGEVPLSSSSLASLRLSEAAGGPTFHATLVDLEKKRCLDRS